MFRKIQKLHFVGIGGIGMSGIAELLLNLGYQVSGSDLKTEPRHRQARRRSEGKSTSGTAPKTSKAPMSSSSPPRFAPTILEVIEAKRLQIPVIPRAEMLAELMRLKYGVAIAGSHGKTTTTSMIATVLVHGGFDPTAVIGGRLERIRKQCQAGQRRFSCRRSG